MNRTEVLREVRMLRFVELYGAWRLKRVTQAEAGEVLGMSGRTFRRWALRYEAGGREGLRDRRSLGGSHRRAPEEEIRALESLYAGEYGGWNVRHFWERYRDAHGGMRSYTWVKNRLQAAGLVERGRRRGRHRKWRPRKVLEGLMLHQDGSTHRWFGDGRQDLVITMDDATSQVYSGFFVEQEGTWSSLRGVRETIAAKGVFASLYTDRGSHYWYTPTAGGKVDRTRPTQFGRAMGELGIEMIPSYSPQGRGRCERCFGTLQGRVPRELARVGIREMAAANEYLREYWPRHNAAFGVKAQGAGTAFVPLLEVELGEILCLKETRVVRNDNCVAYRGKVLQIPPQRHRIHYVRAEVEVREYEDGRLAVFHDRHRLGRYGPDGRLEEVRSSAREAA
jgi:hypothetical protein